MYTYQPFDHAFVQRRIAQFRDQINRRLHGSLTEEEFKPLRLMNGLYLQLHAYMLRVAIPYGTFNPSQLRQMAYIADRWDKGYGHFTTRQNIQYNWPQLANVADILEALAEVEMHAIQTSGNCIRNVTADHFAGAAADEIEDPRPTAELIRQWSTDHPEFMYLPRKFKIALTGSPQDRAVTWAHDIGLRMQRDAQGAPGYTVLVGGGLGRTPVIGQVIREFLPKAELLPYLEAILSVYNSLGRRDNLYKARIKITVQQMGLAAFQNQVEQRFAQLRHTFSGADQTFLTQLETAFAPLTYKTGSTAAFEQAQTTDPNFRVWARNSLSPHKNSDYAIVTVSLKAHGQTPGDIRSDQMRALADLAETYGHHDLRASHEQNLILPHVHKGDLPQLYAGLCKSGLATANIGLISDMIVCPGMDYCALAMARSIPIAQQIATRFDALRLEHQIGSIKLKISGCINACGHHHVGHIGILGMDRGGVESYQITLGGDHTEQAALGRRTGRGFSYAEIIPALERLLLTYLDQRTDAAEPFIDTLRRLGPAPFKTALYTSDSAHVT